MIPDTALQQHLVILGKTGSGKSFAARGIVERLLDLGRRVCILDYTGVWSGLRSNAGGIGRWSAAGLLRIKTRAHRLMDGKVVAGR